MIEKMRRIGITLLLSLLVLPLAAQQVADTAYLFRFVPHKDLFYVPFKGNDAEMNRLCAVLKANIDLLREGKMFICVSSYAASGNETMSAGRMGYLRSHRVKSELITHTGITEQMFVTDRQISAAYGDTLRNVVVIAFPASVEKVEKIAGAKAAEAVRTYYREIEEQKQEEVRAKQEIIARETEAQRKAEAETLRAAQEARRIAEEQKQEQEAQRQAEAEKARLANQSSTATTDHDSHHLSLRANLLSWATLTPDLGVEWRINSNWGVLLNGSWTSWSWDNTNRRYALWKVSPAIHYYIGMQKRGYVGAMYHTGQFNYKFSETGKQGDYHGGGIVGGYQLPIGNCLSLDFNLGVGYTRADYERYKIIEGTKVRQGSDTKNYWGINQVGVTLVWKLF